MINIEEDPLCRSILKTLIYFDLFRYPLTAEEVHGFLPEPDASLETTQTSLNEMVGSESIYQFGHFYCVQNSPELELRRTNGNALAAQYMKKARLQANIISHFPFVEGVMVSGSLSKGYADHTSDIDFFIVTKPGRLWIARTLLVLYKRIWLFNSHKYFCVNYFVDADHLDIKERNIYSAIELVTLIPLFGHRLYLELMERNNWVRAYCPNFSLHENFSAVLTPSYLRTRAVLEGVIERLRPEMIDRFLMKLTFRRWKRLYGDFNRADFQLAFKTNRHVSKSHQNNFQKKILINYENRIRSVTTLMHTTSTV